MTYHFLELLVDIVGVVRLEEPHGQWYMPFLILSVELVSLQEHLILLVLFLELIFACTDVGFEPGRKIPFTKLACRQVRPDRVKLADPATGPVRTKNLKLAYQLIGKHVFLQGFWLRWELSSTLRT